MLLLPLDFVQKFYIATQWQRIVKKETECAYAVHVLKNKIFLYMYTLFNWFPDLLRALISWT